MKISNPVLAPANDQAVYINEGSLMHLDANFDEGRLLIEDVAGASHVKWSLDGEYVAFILNGRLQIVTVSTKQLVEVPLQNVSQFEWGAETVLYVTAEAGALYKWSFGGDPKLLLEEAIIEAYCIATARVIVKREQQLFVVYFSGDDVLELQEITLQSGQYGHVTFSFSGQYVAYIGETKTERHVYVYHFDLGLTQNLTEMLDVYAGDAMNPHLSSAHGVKEIQWTETDALYFLLSSDGDVRLYYADVYGSLFPASPESEHINSFSVAASGNWALYIADQPFIETSLEWFDITMGEGRTLIKQEIKVPSNVETFYEMVDDASGMLYIWGYVPAQAEIVNVVLSGKGRMLGNGYAPYLADQLIENKAVVYINHPGAFGYGLSYTRKEFIEDEDKIQKLIVNWLEQKTGRIFIIDKIVK